MVSMPAGLRQRGRRDRVGLPAQHHQGGVGRLELPTSIQFGLALFCSLGPALGILLGDRFCNRASSDVLFLDLAGNRDAIATVII